MSSTIGPSSPQRTSRECTNLAASIQSTSTTAGVIPVVLPSKYCSFLPSTTNINRQKFPHLHGWSSWKQQQTNLKCYCNSYPYATKWLSLKLLTYRWCTVLFWVFLWFKLELSNTSSIDHQTFLCRRHNPPTYLIAIFNQWISISSILNFILQNSTNPINAEMLIIISGLFLRQLKWYVGSVLFTLFDMIWWINVKEISAANS